MMKRFSIALIAAALLAICLQNCTNEPKDVVEENTPTETDHQTMVSSFSSNLGPGTLSEYGFFVGDMKDMKPSDRVLPYDLNTPLFTDYAHKQRFVYIPEGQTANFNPKEVMDFPDGTVLIKNFFYPHDFTDASSEIRIMETRLLVKKEGKWSALPYIWNDEQTEAYLEVAGGRMEASWTHYDGNLKTVDYVVPNMNQCKGCHVIKDKFMPIGPSARMLNGTYTYEDGPMNQLKKWEEMSMLTGLPEDLGTVDKAAVWDDPHTGSLDARARAYLDINCGHCHRDDGPANTSGLLLNFYEEDLAALGIYKSPVAAGRGSGDLEFDINPGHSHESIIWYRMNSSDPGIMMPELGRKLIHEEGVALIEEWIDAMEEPKSKPLSSLR